MAWSEFRLILDDAWRALYGTTDLTTIVETTLKAIAVYGFTLILVRSGKSRMLGRSTLFDIVLVFVLGSMLSRAINGSAEPLPSAIAAIALVGLHGLFGIIAWHYHGFGKLVKGQANDLVRDGETLRDSMHKHHVSERDLQEAMHKHGLEKIEDVKLARLERDGSITIVPGFRILEVEVQEGVQRIRIEV